MSANPESGTSGSPETSKDSRKDLPQASPTEAAREAAASSKPSEAATLAGGKPVEANTKSGDGEPHEVKARKGQFLIAARHQPGMQMMGFAPLQFSAVEQALRASPDIEIIDRVGQKEAVGVLGSAFQENTGVLVALMHEDKAQALALQAQGQLIVERDQPLHLLDVNYAPPDMVTCSMPTAGPALRADFLVLGNGKPVKDAEVYLFGSLLPATGVTNENGQVSLTLFGESTASVRRLYVKPKMDYWSFYQEQPDISDVETNVIGLRALSEWPTLANFPQQQSLGWGQKVMRLDQLPSHFRGQGVKIAIIDSGAANTHEDLRKITRGFDIINKATNPNGWNIDTISHGSHCAGVIAGADTASGVRGFAPDAEIHACRLFPGGQISQLIEGLEYCIEKKIDIVNLSLGGAQPSEALEQQIRRARNAGIACIVAAGNSGGAVQYPAASPHVLAVAAIGRLNEFPPDSYHTQTLTAQVDSNGFYAARFSCYGPEIAVCAPGVAIASSVPDNNFAAWDGTSMAAPHITGLAALVLAHHPDFQGMSLRNTERVEHLFRLIKMSCRPVQLSDPRKTGFGLPDVLLALGLVQARQTVPMGAALSGMMAAPGGHPAMHNFIGNAYRDRPQPVMPLSAMPGFGLANVDPYTAWLSSMASYGMPPNYPRPVW